MKKRQTFFLSIMLLLCMMFAPPKVQAQNIPVERAGIEFTHWCDLPGAPGMCITTGDVGQIFIHLEPSEEVFLEVTNTNVVTVSFDSYDYSYKWNVHALSAGEAVISIISLDSSYTELFAIKVIVKDLQQGEMTIGDNFEIVTGDLRTLIAVSCGPDFPQPFEIKNVTWASSDNTIATIDEWGTVRGIYLGKATITATAPNGVTATCEVTVNRRPPATPKMPKIEIVSGKLESGTLPNGVMSIGSKVRVIFDGEATGIRYSKEGSDPTGLFGEITTLRPTDPPRDITVNEKVTIRAVAFNSEMPWFPFIFSNELKCTLYPQLDKPILFIDGKAQSEASGGQYHAPLYGSKLTMSHSNIMVDNCKIRWTIDRSEPTKNSEAWGILPYFPIITPLTPWGTGITTVKAKVFSDNPDYKESKSFTWNYVVKINDPKVDATTGTISCATPLVNIKYKLDDSDAIKDYTGPITGLPNPQTKITTWAQWENNSLPIISGWVRSNDVIATLYNDSPIPKVQLWNFFERKFVTSDKTNFTVAFEDSIVLATPDYPMANIRFNDKGMVSETQGNDWNPKYRFPILASPTTITTYSKLGPRPRSPVATYKFNIFDFGDERPYTSIGPGGQVIDAGTEFCLQFNAPHDGFVVTTDGSTPYIESQNCNIPIPYANYKYRGLLVPYSYLVYGPPYSVTNNGCKYVNGYKDGFHVMKQLSVDNSCTFKVVAFKKTPDGGVVMSKEAWFSYKVAARKDSLDIENGTVNRTLPTPPKQSCGLGGKLLKLVFEKISGEAYDYYDNTIAKSISNFSICRNMNLPSQASDKAIQEKSEEILNALKQDKAKAMSELSKVITPYEFSSGGSGFGFHIKTGGLLQLDSDNTLNGGIAFEGSANVDSQIEYPLGPFSLHVKFGVWGNLNAQLILNMPLNKPKETKATGSLEYDIWVKTAAGIGIPYLASLNIHFDGKFYHKWVMNTNKHDMKLLGEIYATATLVGFSPGRYDFLIKEHIFYDEIPKSASSDSTTFLPDIFDINHLFTSSVANKSNSTPFKWKVLPRKYLAKRSAWLGSVPPAKNGSMLTVLQESIYSETAPKIAEGAGKRVMVFLADDELRDDYNRSVLMYSVYNSGTNTWSTPVAVNNNGKADYLPSIASNGTDIWVTWQNSNILFTASSTPEDVFAAGKICVAKFNGATNTFTQLSNLSDGFAPKIAVSPTGDACAAWSHNPSGDFLGTNMQTKIRESHSASGVWSTTQDLKTGLGAILDKDISWFNGKYQIAYITDRDNNTGTINDRDLILIDNTGAVLQTPVANKLVSGIRFSAIGNTKVLSYLEEGNHRYLPEGGTPVNLTDSADMDFENYRIFSNGTKTVVVYPGSESDVGYIFARNYENGKLGAPYKLVAAIGHANNFDGVLESTGDFYIVFNKSVMKLVDDEIEEENNLVSLRCPTPVNLRLMKLDYNQVDVKLGKPMPVKLDVANIGGVAVNSVIVKVNGTAAGTYPLSLKTGEIKTLDFNMNVPSTMTPLTKFDISVEPAGVTDVDINDNLITMTLGFVNFRMLLTPEIKDGHKITVTAEITNNSDFAANTQLITRIGEDGQVVGLVDLGNFAGRLTKTYSLDYDIDDICAEGEGIRLYLELVSDKDAEYKTNNFVLVTNLNGTIRVDSLLGVGIEEYEPPFGSNSVLVYPNPTTGEVRVELRQTQFTNGELGIETVDVYDMFGRRVLSHTPHPTPQTSFNITHLQSGIYFLRIKTGNDLVVKKLIKY